MAKKKQKDEFKVVQKALSGLKAGESKRIRVGPGPSGVILVKKGKERRPSLAGVLPVKSRAKVIRK